ncbi:hypothetical protein HDU86_004889 [Geranomyces michiganensis]|nr:hypothetical protein HDU86_004889 [Geranomyces michiganensis]
MVHVSLASSAIAVVVLTTLATAEPNYRGDWLQGPPHPYQEYHGSRHRNSAWRPQKGHGSHRPYHAAAALRPQPMPWEADEDESDDTPMPWEEEELFGDVSPNQPFPWERPDGRVASATLPGPGPLPFPRPGGLPPASAPISIPRPDFKPPSVIGKLTSKSSAVPKPTPSKLVPPVPTKKPAPFPKLSLTLLKPAPPAPTKIKAPEPWPKPIGMPKATSSVVIPKATASVVRPKATPSVVMSKPSSSKVIKPKPTPTATIKPKKVTVEAGYDQLDFIGVVKIGNPPQDFNLRFDTGTQLTWVQKELPGNKEKLPVSGFNPAKSKTFRAKKSVGNMKYSCNGENAVVNVIEGQDQVSLGDVKTNITIGVHEGTPLMKDADGYFGLSLQAPGNPAPWLYEAVREGICDPIFSLKASRNEASSVSVCAYNDQIPTRINHVTAKGQKAGFWQTELLELLVGKAVISMTPGSAAVSATGNRAVKPIEALIDSGSPYIQLPKFAVDEVHRLIGATCPGPYSKQFKPNDRNGTVTGLFAPRNGLFEYEQCSLPCDSVFNLPKINFKFATGDHPLSPQAYLQRGPDSPNGDKQCFSAFTSFKSAEPGAEALVVLGTSFIQQYSPVFWLGKVAGMKPRDGSKLTRRQAITLGDAPGLAWLLNDGKSWV